MPTTLYTAERLDLLADRLADELRRPDDDPFVADLVVVPSFAMRRWLEQQLAQRIGIAANIRFVLPGALVAELRDMTDGARHPWRKAALIGHVFGIAQELNQTDDDWLASVRGDTDSFMDRARYIGDLFDRYGVHRPDMVHGWDLGHDRDGGGAPLTPDQLWQPQLWRAVRDRIGVSAADALGELLERVAAGEPAALPDTIHVFGLSAMSNEFLRVLDALSHARHVSISSFTASQVVTDEVMLDRPGMARHPLLESWGRSERDSRELLRNTLPTVEHHGLTRHDFTATDEEANEADDPAWATLLVRLQQRIRGNLDGAITAEALIEPDASVQFHGCSGPQRQVEVLRDALLHLLADDPTLTEADIAIVCPQRDRFAPVIEATWGRSAHHDEPIARERLPQLRYAVNHRQATEAPLITALRHLITLLPGRLTHSEIASLLALGPLRRRWGLDDDLTHGEIVEWLERTAMRWGLDPEHRTAHGTLPSAFSDHTLTASAESIVGSMAWSEGAITTMGRTALRVDLSQFDLAATFADLADELRRVEHLWRTEPATIDEWIQRLQRAAEFFFAVDPEEQWQWTRLERLWQAVLELAPAGVALDLADVSSAIDEALVAPSGRRVFGRGTIVVDEPQALRQLPHRVIALLGFDDGALPRTIRASDDLIAAVPRLGDRDRRLDAKQSLLDCVLAARDHLLVTFTDHHPHTNADVPPSLPLAELMAACEQAAGIDDLSKSGWIISHTRHAHTAVNFDPAAPGGQSFDDLAMEFQQTLGARSADVGFVALEPLELDRLDEVSVDDLVQSIGRPLRTFATETLGLRFAPENELPSDVLPVDPSPLEKWTLGHDRLQSRLNNETLETWAARKRAAGQLPPGSLGDRVVDDIDAIVSELVGATGDQLESLMMIVPAPIDLTIDGQHIVGTIETVAGGPFRLTYSSRYGADEFQLWARALLLAAETRQPVTAHMFSRKSGPKPTVEAWTCTVRRNKRAVDQAVRFLLERHHEARTRPVPVFRKTSGLLLTRGPDVSATREAWYHESMGYGDRTDRAVAPFFGDLDFDALMMPEVGVADAANAITHHMSATATYGAVER